jgi:hypothetical protein
MKISKLILFTHIFFGLAIIILLIRAIFFGSCWFWILLNLAIYFNTWASLERSKERREMERKIKILKEKDEKSNPRFRVEKTIKTPKLSL